MSWQGEEEIGRKGKGPRNYLVTNSLLDSLLLCETVWAGPGQKEKERRITKVGIKHVWGGAGVGGHVHQAIL